ncbi:GNAT family N-acetyltransferase [Bacillaceae bacterium W0354]
MFTKQIDHDLQLRLIDTGDAEELFQLTNQSRDHLREWLPWLDSTTKIVDTLNFIRHCKKEYAESRGLNCVILYKGKIAGVIGYNSIDWTNQIAYIGYWLGEGFQGHGIMTRAVQTLTDYAFNELKLNKVDIRAAEGNLKSRAIPERLGFVQEGRIRQGEWLYDHFVDHVVYGMLASEWKGIDERQTH